MIYDEQDIKRAVAAAQELVLAKGIAATFLSKEDFYKAVLEHARKQVSR